MTTVDDKLDRVATIVELVTRGQNRLGRTALMKYLYFLKIMRDVPLPYSFRLYTYGPFNSDVLDDLQYAEFLDAVESTLVAYPGGRAYEYHRGRKADEIKEKATEFIIRHEPSIDWVLKEFGGRSAVDLEMASTIVYIDRMIAARNAKVTIEVLAKKVHDVKPHLPTSIIEAEARRLNKRRLLKAAG
jgi:uncharacterized protein YwgA